MKKDRKQISCQNCKFWSFDMDMDPFCVHPKAGDLGTNTNAMRGTKRLHFAKALCGPTAKFFEQGKGHFAKKEISA